jgi:tetrahydromethanopterin S-methyltransferase subunit F
MGTQQYAGCGKPQVRVIPSIHITSVHGISTSTKEIPTVTDTNIAAIKTTHLTVGSLNFKQGLIGGKQHIFVGVISLDDVKRTSQL